MNYSELSDEAIKNCLRKIIASSSSEEEIRERIRKELNCSYIPAIHSMLPIDQIGREARVLVLGLGGSVMKNGAMVQLMIFSPRGEIIHV